MWALQSSLALSRPSLCAVTALPRCSSVRALTRGLSFAPSASPAAPVRAAIVGGGPSGLYTAKYLLKDLPTVNIDIFEALPTPFGLVRYGVAPDHPEVKVVQNDFTRVLEDPRCRFFGNVAIGRDLPLEELRKHYSAVILAYGAAADRPLGIPGEHLRGVHSARSFVAWYNGHPNSADQQYDLSGDTAVVIGQGNVAIDVARMLLAPIDHLRNTDIAEHALEALSRSKIRRVYLVGRRGVVQAAYSTKELREITALPSVATFADSAEIQAGMTPASVQELEKQQTARKLKKLQEALTKSPPTEDAARAAGLDRFLHLRFLSAPHAIEPSAADPTTAGSISLQRTRLEGEANNQKAVADSSIYQIQSNFIVKSIGYKSVPIEGAPFDSRAGVVPNKSGVVTGVPGLYVSGWLKRGPIGIINDTLTDAKDTVHSIVADAKENKLPANEAISSDITAALQKRNLSWVDLAAWQRLDAEEARRGALVGKPREKILDVQEMMRVALGK